MRRVIVAVAGVSLLLAVAGCSKPSSELPPPSPQTAAAPVDPAGHIVVGQAPPATNGLASIVVLDPDPARELPPPADKPVMDQVAQMFMPDVLFVRTGQPVEFRNSDDMLHNIDTKQLPTNEPAFNVAIPLGGTYVYTFAREGLFHVHCDIHLTMSALIVSAPTPYAKLADPDGRFEFDDVQPGRYIVKAYAGTATLEQPLDVRGPRTDVTIRN